MKTLYSLFLGIVLLSTACRKEDAPEVIDYGYDYFPLQQGSWKEYRVDSVLYSPFGMDSSQWIIREITDTLVDVGTDQTEATIFLFRRHPDSLTWEPSYTVKRLSRNSAQAEEWVENTRFIRLVFPAYGGRSWDGNAMNSFGNQDYTIDKLAYSDSISGTFYPDLLNVVQQKRITLISQDTDEETFSRNTGLVGVRKTHLLNTTSVKTGYTLTKTLIASGFL